MIRQRKIEKTKIRNERLQKTRLAFGRGKTVSAQASIMNVFAPRTNVVFFSPVLAPTDRLLSRFFHLLDVLTQSFQFVFGAFEFQHDFDTL